MHIPILTDIVIILALSVVIIFLFHKLRLHPILGFLITGVICGPGGLSLVNRIHEVEIMAEIGVILLLFVIGMEFSLRTLISVQRAIFLGGGFQVLFTAGVTFLIATAMGFEWNRAVFLGFLLSLSSTAIVLSIQQDRGGLVTPAGRVTLAILIFQDIIVVPMMLFTPMLGGGAADVSGDLLRLLAKVAVVVVLVIVGARYLVPRVLHEVARTRNRELFLISIVLICFAVAWGTSELGLSLAFGAFLAGLIISESEYSHQATAQILPFREIFTGFFFVSVGMLLDLSFFTGNLPLILLLTLSVVAIKGMIAMGATLLQGGSRRTSLLSGLALFQIGEFAFILSTVGLESDLLDPSTYQYFLAVSILSMAVTPFVMDKDEQIANWVLRRTLPERLDRFDQLNEQVEEEPDEALLKDHIIIVGYGVTGRNVARAAHHARLPYVVVDLDPERIAEARRDGHPTAYGDAKNEFMLRHLGVFSARIAVIAVSQPEEARVIVRQIRQVCPTVYLIARTRMVKDVETFYELGANEIVPEEFETSIEVLTRVLNRYFVSRDEVETFTETIRERMYQLFPSQRISAQNRGDLLGIPDLNISCLKAQHANNDVIGKTLAEADLRRRFGVSVIALLRGEQFITDIYPQTEILQDDILYVLGQPESVASLNEHLRY